jgi:hypothetical protein
LIWLSSTFLSDTSFPIYKAYPFKLNPQWILEQDFVVMVQELWNDPKYLEEDGKQKRLIWKLKDLKDNTKQWQKLRYQEANAHLRGLENDINSLLQNTLDGVITQEEETLLKTLE